MIHFNIILSFMFSVHLCYIYNIKNNSFYTTTICYKHYFVADLARDSSVVITDSVQPGRSEDRIPFGTRIFTPVQTAPGAHPASYRMGTGSFPRVKRLGRGADHPLNLASRLKNE
jgi:hypothetical protein